MDETQPIIIPTGADWVGDYLARRRRLFWRRLFWRPKLFLFGGIIFGVGLAGLVWVGLLALG